MPSAGVPCRGATSGGNAPVVRTVRRSVRSFVARGLAARGLARGAVALTLLALAPSCGRRAQLRQDMQSIGRATEAVAAAVELARLPECRAAARSLRAQLSSEHITRASEEDAWRGILSSCREAVDGLVEADSIGAARRALQRVERSCWLCHEHYIGATESWAAR